MGTYPNISIDYLPDDTVSDLGKLVRVLPNYRRASAGTGLQLVYTSRPPVSPAVAAFAEFLLEKLGEAPGILQSNVGRP